MQTIEQRKPVSGFHLITFGDTAFNCLADTIYTESYQGYALPKGNLQFLIFPFSTNNLENKFILGIVEHVDRTLGASKKC